MNREGEKYILLSFDTEEFDVPREQGVEISLERGMEVSVAGTTRILDILKENAVRATFFCTATFAKNAPLVMRRIIDAGHEVASHGVDHWQPKESDVVESKQILEELCHCTVSGYRQPRMFPVENSVLEQAGYRYNSSLHPTFIPGRYMHLNVPRTPFHEGALLQIPASVTPWLRMPLFWLACHHYPQWLYKRLCLRTLRHDGQFVIYFHPWEFYDLKAHREWKIPYTIRHNSGDEMSKRLHSLIQSFKSDNAQFITYSEYSSMR